MYVLVMTTVIYNSPHDLSFIALSIHIVIDRYLGRSVISPRAYIYPTLFKKYNPPTLSQVCTYYLPTSLQQRQPFSSRFPYLYQMYLSELRNIPILVIIYHHHHRPTSSSQP